MSGGGDRTAVAHHLPIEVEPEFYQRAKVKASGSSTILFCLSSSRQTYIQSIIFVSWKILRDWQSMRFPGSDRVVVWNKLVLVQPCAGKCKFCRTMTKFSPA